MGIYESYQGGRIEQMYVFIQQHTNFVDVDGEIVEL